MAARTHNCNGVNSKDPELSGFEATDMVLELNFSGLHLSHRIGGVAGQKIRFFPFETVEEWEVLDRDMFRLLVDLPARLTHDPNFTDSLDGGLEVLLKVDDADLIQDEVEALVGQVVAARHEDAPNPLDTTDEEDEPDELDEQGLAQQHQQHQQHQQQNEEADYDDDEEEVDIEELLFGTGEIGPAEAAGATGGEHREEVEEVEEVEAVNEVVDLDDLLFTTSANVATEAGDGNRAESSSKSSSKPTPLSDSMATPATAAHQRNEWVGHVDDTTQRRYEVNSRTGESRWVPTRDQPSHESAAGHSRADSGDVLLMASPMSAAGANEDMHSAAEHWVAMTCKDSGRPYWYHRLHRTSSWQRPDGGLQTQLADKEASGGDDHSGEHAGDEDPEDPWMRVMDPSTNRYYYVHRMTHETSWSKPVAPSQSVAPAAAVSQVARMEPRAPPREQLPISETLSTRPWLELYDRLAEVLNSEVNPPLGLLASVLEGFEAMLDQRDVASAGNFFALGAVLEALTEALVIAVEKARAFDSACHIILVLLQARVKFSMTQQTAIVDALLLGGFAKHAAHTDTVDAMVVLLHAMVIEDWHVEWREDRSPMQALRNLQQCTMILLAKQDDYSRVLISRMLWIVGTMALDHGFCRSLGAFHWTKTATDAAANWNYTDRDINDHVIRLMDHMSLYDVEHYDSIIEDGGVDFLEALMSDPSGAGWPTETITKEKFKQRIEVRQYTCLSNHSVLCCCRRCCSIIDGRLSHSTDVVSRKSLVVPVYPSTFVVHRMLYA